MGSRAGIVAALAAVSAACSLFVSTTDFAGDQTPAADAGAADAAVAPDVAALPADAGADVAAPGARFCAAHASALFCDDFSGPSPDQDMALATDPGGFPDGGKATITIDTSDFLSPPGALHVVTGADGAGAYLAKTLSSAPNGVACEVSFRADRAPDLDYAILELRTDSSIATIAAGLLRSYAPTTQVTLTTLATAPPSWRRWRLSIAPSILDAGPKAGQRRVWVEEVSPNPRLLAESFVQGEPVLGDAKVTLGVAGYSAPSIDIHFDDLLCEKLAP